VRHGNHKQRVGALDNRLLDRVALRLRGFKFRANRFGFGLRQRSAFADRRDACSFVCSIRLDKLAAHLNDRRPLGGQSLSEAGVLVGSLADLGQSGEGRRQRIL
jgi:hypothetical protein